MPRFHTLLIAVLFLSQFSIGSLNARAQDVTPTETSVAPTETEAVTPTPTPGVAPTHTPTPTITLTDDLTPTAEDTAVPAEFQALQASTSTEPTLRVRAYIDGRSRLVIKGDTVYWHHLDFAAPGRWLGQNLPTYLNGTEWFPAWPGSGENRSCNCNSSSSVGIPALAAQAQTVSLSIVQARYNASIVQQPGQSNDYTLIVEFNDNPPSGAAWYEITLTYVVASPPTPTPTATPVAPKYSISRYVGVDKISSRFEVDAFEQQGCDEVKDEIKRGVHYAIRNVSTF